MNWQYFYPSRVAKHLVSGATYIVSRDNSTGEPSFSPSADGVEVDETELDSLHKLYDGEKNRYDLQGLLKELFLDDYAKAVVVLNNTPGRKVSVRTLQAWQLAPTRTSSRTCPSWAVTALRTYKENYPGEIAAFKEMVEYRRQATGNTRSRVDRVYNSDGVAIAERRLVLEDAYREKFCSASMLTLPRIVADELLDIKERHEHMCDSYFSLLGALQGATSFEELKAMFLSNEDDRNRSDNFVKSTYNALRNNEEEFASEDGTLPEDTSTARCVFPGS